MAAIMSEPTASTTTIANASASSFFGTASFAQRLPWLLCFGLSLLYFAYFWFKPCDCPYSPQGFCVKNYLPREHRCAPGVGNSHQWSFLVDCAYTAAVLAIGFMLPKGWHGNQGPLSAIGCAFIIFFHGLLHAVFGYILPCHVPEGPVEWVSLPATNPVMLVTYGVFIFGLCFVSLKLIAADAIAENWLLNGTLSITTTAIIVQVGIGGLAKGQSNVSAIFGGTQLLLSGIAAFFPKPGVVTTTQGYFFIAPCLISFLERLSCCSGSGPERSEPGLFDVLGGHVWYDLTLHLVIIIFQFSGKAIPTTGRATPTSKSQDPGAPAIPFSKSELMEKKFP